MATKDIPSWQRKEPMTITEARRKTMNWLRNSTQCCYSGPEGPRPPEPCKLHNPAWIEAEAKKRMEVANQWMGWTNRLGDLVRGMSAVRVGRMLADAGYRDEKGQPSQRALNEELAAWVEFHGYPVPIWNPERVRETLAADPVLTA